MQNSLLTCGFILFSLLSCSKNNALRSLEPNFTAIIVDNINQSIEWYNAILGFEVINKTDLKERGIQQANLRNDQSMLELIQLDSALSQKSLLKDYSKKTKIEGFFKIGFSVDNFDKWITHLEKSNVQFHGNIVKDKLSDKQMIIILDPDGNRIQIFEK